MISSPTTSPTTHTVTRHTAPRTHAASFATCHARGRTALPGTAHGDGQGSLHQVDALLSNPLLESTAVASSLRLASAHEQILYVVALADRTPLPDQSVDLVTVASAFHWLDFPRFFDEVRRVARPNGILAVWGY